MTPDKREFTCGVALVLVWAVENFKDFPYSLNHLLTAILDYQSTLQSMDLEIWRASNGLMSRKNIFPKN